MGHIFINYSRRDTQFVDTLRSRLESNGIQVWLDRTDIQGGNKWRREIVEAIEGAEAILVILSRYSVQSDNVRKELDIAEGQKAKIIPVEIEPIEIPADFKYQLAGLQLIKIGSNFDAGFSQLLDALQKSAESHQNIKLQPLSSYVQEGYKSVIYKYAQLIKDKSIYFLAAIPEDMLSVVYQQYAENALIMKETPLCLVRGKGLNSGHGILITNLSLYWKDNVFGSGKSVALKTIITIEPIPLITIGNPGLRINSKINVYRSDVSRKNLKLISSMVQELARL